MLAAYSKKAYVLSDMAANGSRMAPRKLREDLNWEAIGWHALVTSNILSQNGVAPIWAQASPAILYHLGTMLWLSAAHPKAISGLLGAVLGA